jgi:hypothetical protein
VPPDGAAADLIRETGAGIVAAPDDLDAIAAGLEQLHGRWAAGSLDAPPLSDEWRDRLSRRARVQDLADLLWSLEA